jgi:hypothetical protein
VKDCELNDRQRFPNALSYLLLTYNNCVMHFLVCEPYVQSDCGCNTCVGTAHSAISATESALTTTPPMLIG